MEYNYQKIGDLIRDERKKLGYNQDEFLEKLKEDNVRISRNTLSKIESGNLPPEKFTISLLIAMCKLFNCDIGYLLGEYNEKTRNERIIKEEINLSSKAINTIKKNMHNSIKKAPGNNPFSFDNESLPPKNLLETYGNALNLILEEYPELIAYIGRIMLHKELDLYTDFTQRGRVRINKVYDIDQPLLNLAIQIKHYVENQEKMPTHKIGNTMRYEYAVQFITKHMRKLEKENQLLLSDIEELYRTTNDSNEFYT